MSGASDPPNRIEKKLRNAKEILCKMILFYLAGWFRPGSLQDDSVWTMANRGREMVN